MSTPRAPSTVCARLASSPPPRVGSVWVRVSGGNGQALPQVCPLLPSLPLNLHPPTPPGPQVPGTRNCSFPHMHHPMANAFMEPLLTQGRCGHDKVQTIIILVQAELTISLLKPN